MGSVVHMIWIVLQVIIAVYLVSPLAFFLVYLVKGVENKPPVAGTTFDYAIIITAYKNSDNLNHVVRSLLTMTYPNFVVYVVADGCPEYKDEFNDPRVVVLHPPELLSNQVRSHFFAINNFVREHELLTIIDSDNLVTPRYLEALNPYFAQGYQAVQGVRKAKNLDTPYACLDALNELYYLFYDRQILFKIGASSMLSGSGMAFTVALFRKCMESVTETGAGFDKILQNEIISSGHRIAFAEDAVVYDEKTSHAGQLVKQRARWNNTWFRYYRYGLGLIGKGLSKFNWNQLVSGFILTRPPLFMLLIISGLILVINLFTGFTGFLIWLLLFFLFFTGFFLALVQSDTDPRIYKAMVHIPKFMWMQVVSLGKARKANEISVATEHSHNKEIEKI